MNRATSFITASVVLASGFAHGAHAQSLFMQPSQPTAVDQGPMISAQSASMFAVIPPEPREFAKHDIITIIVDETSRQSSSQTLETEKETRANLGVDALIDPWRLLELQLRQGALSDTSLLEADLRREYAGEGEYERADQFSARIAATVLDVKPNGTLVLEARKIIKKDEEVQTMLLSGMVREEDVTNANTVLSSQLADLSLSVVNTGDVRNAAKKGLITRVLDTLFAF